MGWVAKSSHSLSRESVNLLPMNWLVIIVAGIFSLCFWGMGLFEGRPIAILGAIPCTLITLAYLVSFFKLDTFFVSQPLPELQAVAGDTVLATGFGWTGRLRLHEKAAKRFIDMPAQASRLEDGSLVVASHIDASTYMYSIVTQSKVGVWLAVPQPATFTIEAGSLYYGFKEAPALRLRFTDGTDSKNRKAILSFDSEQARSAMASWLAAEKAKAGGNAMSASIPQANPDLPFSSSTNSA